VREAAGNRFDHLELGYTVFHITHINGKTDVSFPPSLHVLDGGIDQIVEEILARRERFGFSYIQVQEWQMEAFAPVVARLAGK
jgi:hypothetical protein